MSMVQAGFLILGAGIFLLWTVLMFRTLFRLRRRGEEKSGSVFPGPGETLGQWRNWLTSPEDRSERRWLGLTTLAMFAWIAINAMLIGKL